MTQCTQIESASKLKDVPVLMVFAMMSTSINAEIAAVIQSWFVGTGLIE